ncbi:hypothetical protein J6590_097941, partial [Homalodisca vitripennis]
KTSSEKAGINHKVQIYNCPTTAPYFLACRTLRLLSSVRSVPEVFSHTASVRSAQFSHFLSANLSSRQTVGLVARILCVGFFSAIKCDCAMSSSSGEETAVVALTLAAEEDDLG